jgi:hypothetical protein
VQEAIQQSERASGARRIPRKSPVLPIGRWSAPNDIIGIPCQHHVMILGLHFWGTLRQTVSASWTQLVGLVKIQAKDSYPRDLCLAHRIFYAHVYLLARLWYGPRSFPHLDCAYNRSLQPSCILYGEGPRSEYLSPPYNLAKRTVVGH